MIIIIKTSLKIDYEQTICLMRSIYISLRLFISITKQWTKLLCSNGWSFHTAIIHFGVSSNNEWQSSLWSKIIPQNGTMWLIKYFIGMNHSINSFFLVSPKHIHHILAEKEVKKGRNRMSHLVVINAFAPVNVLRPRLLKDDFEVQRYEMSLYSVVCCFLVFISRSRQRMCLW